MAKDQQFQLEFALALSIPTGRRCSQHKPQQEIDKGEEHGAMLQRALPRGRIAINVPFTLMMLQHDAGDGGMRDETITAIAAATLRRKRAAPAGRPFYHRASSGPSAS